MSLFLKIIFLYLPAIFAYYSIILSVLVYFGYADHPQSFNPDDYTPVHSYVENGTKVTFHEYQE